MKQNILSFLSTIKAEIYNLNKYLYNNPESSYNEINACTYITDLLKKYDFNISYNYLDLKTAFYASKGTTYPKTCFICEYDAISNLGHITGHNLLSSISVASALLLSSVIDEIGGSVIVVGCPGEYLGGTKSVMVKQGTFEDIDLVLMTHPHIITAGSGTSNAIIPLNVKFIGDSGLSFLNKSNYNSLDGILLTFNILNFLLKGFPEDVEINSILSKGGLTPLLIPSESEAKFYIRGKEMDLVKLAENKLREIIIYVSKLIRVNYSISLYEPINEELISNQTLNRLFSHNLKENGIIDINDCKNVEAGLSLGIVSKTVPSIHPYISIVKDDNIKYGSKEFSDATITEFAFDQSMKAALSLAYTAIDVIENPNLLTEVKNEFFSKFEK